MIELGTVDGEKHDPEGLQWPHGISGLEETRDPFVCMHAYMNAHCCIACWRRVSWSPGRCSSNVLALTTIPKKVSAVDGSPCSGSGPDTKLRTGGVVPMLGECVDLRPEKDGGAAGEVVKYTVRAVNTPM